MTQCREAALRLLTRREHSVHELRQKLFQRDFSTALVDELLLRLIDTELLSDQRFAEVFVRSRIGRGHGPVRIRMDLKQKGVADALASQALAEAEADWFELARQQREKRFGLAAELERKEQAKQWRFLQYRGFDAEQVRYALKSD
jgi:regulatory protein